MEGSFWWETSAQASWPMSSASLTISLASQPTTMFATPWKKSLAELSPSRCLHSRTKDHANASQVARVRRVRPRKATDTSSRNHVFSMAEP